MRARAGASFFHLSGWQCVIAESFGHATYFLYAEAEDGREGDAADAEGHPPGT